GIELAQFHIGHSLGVGEVDVRGRNRRNRYVAVNFAAGLEHRQLFIRRRGPDRSDQTEYDETFGAHISHLLRQIRAEQINRERRPFARPRVNVQGAFPFLDEPLHDVETEAGPLSRAFGGEVRLENFRQHFHRDAGPGVAHPQLHQRGGIVHALDVQQPVVWPVLERSQIERLAQNFTADLDAMTQRRALKGVDGEVQQNLDDVGAVHFDAKVFGHRLNAEFVVAPAGMNANELFEVFKQLIHAHARGFLRLPAEKTEVAPGNFHAIPHLPRDDAQAVLDEFQVLHFQPRHAIEALVEHLHETGNDRQRTVDVVDDAGVNVAARFGNLLLDLLVLQFGKQFLHFFGVAVNFTFERAPLHRLADGGADGGKVERLVDVIARAQPQCLTNRVRRFKRRHHDHLDARVHVFEAFQNFDARHAGHANVQHRHVNEMLLRQINRRWSVLGHQHIVFVLENNPQRLSRPVLVVHNQQRAAAFAKRRAVALNGIALGNQWFNGQSHVWKSTFLFNSSKDVERRYCTPIFFALKNKPTAHAAFPMPATP